MFGVLVCGLSGISAAEESFTLRVHPTPVAIGEVCRLAMFAPGIDRPEVVFQNKTYTMRRLDSQSYSVALQTKGMSPGAYRGQIVFRLSGQSLQLPFTIHVAAPVTQAPVGSESAVQNLVMDSQTETTLKMNALELAFDRVSLEKERLQQRLEAMSSTAQETQEIREERALLEKRLAEKEGELSKKSVDLSHAWERLAVQETELRVTAERLAEKESALVSQNREISSKTETLKQWEGVLQQQSWAIETERNVLRETQSDLQRRQQDLQGQLSVLEKTDAVLQVKTQAILESQAALKSERAAWVSQQSEQSDALAEKSQKQDLKESELQQAMAALSIEQKQHESSQASLRKDAEALAKDRASIQEQQQKLAQQEARLMSLYQEFQQHQDRFFGLAEQLQSRMTAMEETQKEERVRSDAMSLRLSQLEQINASLIAPTTAMQEEITTENSKKKTK